MTSTSVALAGESMVVGVPYSLSSNGLPGFVRIYVRAGGWQLEAEVEDPTPDVQSGFGSSVSNAEKVLLVP